MIAADSSTWVAYLAGVGGRDVAALDAALEGGHLFMPPVVLTELLSAPGGSPTFREALARVPLLDITAGYWERVGRTRAAVLRRRRRARLADTLIAQSCMDHQATLIARDGDFRSFVPIGLRLVG